MNLINRVGKYAREVSKLYEKHNRIIKVAAVILTITVAAFLFNFYGENRQSNVIVEKGTSQVGETIDNEFNIDKKAGKSSKGVEVEGDVYVDVLGEVNKPGVYKVKSGSRVFQVIKKAGGITNDGDLSNLNQAEKVSDGQRILVGKIGENNSISSGTNTVSEGAYSDDKVNINVADSMGLQKINGVGPSMASKIISYRQEIGRFNSIDDLRNVNGIGEKTFEKLKNQVKV